MRFKNVFKRDFFIYIKNTTEYSIEAATFKQHVFVFIKLRI